MPSTEDVFLLLKSGASAAEETFDQGLRAAGLRVVTAPTAYDMVAACDQTPGRTRHLILGVDAFGPEEFRLIPLVRREWPGTLIVAFHSSGFEYKGRLAHLVGADVVLATPEEVFVYLEGLAPAVAAAEDPPRTRSAAPRPAGAAPRSAASEGRAPRRPPIAPVPRPPTPPALPRPASEPVVAASAPAPPVPAQGVGAVAEPAAPLTVAPSAEPPSDEAAAPPKVPLAGKGATPSVPPASPPAPPAMPTEAAAVLADTSVPPDAEPLEALLGDDEDLAEARVIGTVELTEEELRLLLGEEEQV